jgi:predicted lipase
MLFYPWDALNQQSSSHSVVTFYTYGQPRVGNAAYASTFAGLVSEYRVVHYADIVPHLPPEVLGFHHVPTEVR